MDLFIKPNPILFGEDARRFLERMKEKRTESPADRARRIKHYEMGKEMMRNGELRKLDK